MQYFPSDFQPPSLLGKRKSNIVFTQDDSSYFMWDRIGFRPIDPILIGCNENLYESKGNEMDMDNCSAVNQVPSNTLILTWKQFQELDKQFIVGKCIIIKG